MRNLTSDNINKWETTSFSKIAEIVMGQSPPGASYNSDGIGIPLLNGPTEFTDRHPIARQWTSNPTKICEDGDILLCVRGSSTGRMNISDGEYCIGRGIAAIRKKTQKGSTEYLHYLLEIILHEILRRTAGSTFPNIDKKSLSSIHVSMPPIIEQVKIAHILSTWDEAIAVTEKLIAALKQRKKGLMQRLLTGQVRFPGFEDEWKVSSLEECCEILDKQRIPLNSEERNKRKGKIPYWGANGILDYIDDYIFDEPLIIMAEDGGYFDEAQNRPICHLLNGKCWVNNHAHVLRAKSNILREWVYYWFVHRNIVPYINSGTRTKLNQKDLRTLPILIPEIDEQTKIIKVLVACDEEVKLISRMLDYLKKQKKGLMQRLMTGQVRVKVEE